MDQIDPNNVPLPQDNDGGVSAEVIQQGFKEVQMELRAQGLAKQVREYNGEGNRCFHEWRKDVDRVGTVLSAECAQSAKQDEN